jgi:DNA ligase-associated metallophosphoesterase
VKLKIRDQTCHFLPEKAIYWEEEKTIIIADIHIGKGTVFRKAGIPIPQGIMDEDLMNISKIVHRVNAKKCIIVGDLIHAHSGLSIDVKKKFSQWLHDIHCEVHLVCGNHDHALLKHLPQEWPLHLHQEIMIIEPFLFSHFPTSHAQWFVWSGHLHPKVEISSAYDRLVLRCFQIFPHLGILPAFGFFVGGTMIQKNADSQIYAIVDDTVIQVY